MILRCEITGTFLRESPQKLTLCLSVKRKFEDSGQEGIQFFSVAFVAGFFNTSWPRGSVCTERKSMVAAFISRGSCGLMPHRELSGAIFAVHSHNECEHQDTFFQRLSAWNQTQHNS